MPIYHFNLNDHFLEVDEEGTELASLTEARIQAIKFAGNYLGDNPHVLDDASEFKVEVTDDDEKIMFTVAIELTGGTA